MKEETVNYENYTFSPSQDVLVPVSTYIAITNMMQAIEKEYSKKITTDVYAMFHKDTHQRLSDKSRAKMKPEKLEKEYYENIDFDATSKNIRVDRQELGLAALRLMSEFRGIFRHNVDKGNAIERPTATLQKEEDES